MPAYKEERGTWLVSFYYEDWDGTKKRKLKRGFRTKKEALEFERTYTVKMNGSIDMLFKDYYELYKEDTKPSLKLNTWKNKAYRIETKILPFFGDLKVGEISPAIVKKWHNILLNAENAKGEPYAPTYLKSIHSEFSCMMNHAVTYYGLRQNPCKVTGSIGKGKSDKEVAFWTVEEYERFIETVKDKDISFYAFEILYWTGIRIGELRALTKKDFDFDKGVMKITKSTQTIDGEEVVTEPKTAKSVRDIYLPDFLIKELKDYFLKIAYFGDDDPIFPKYKTYFNKELARGIAKCGVKKIKLHGLRHSHISYLVSLGYSPADIAQRSGHENYKIMYSYAHAYPNRQKDIVRDLEKAGDREHESSEISQLRSGSETEEETTEKETTEKDKSGSPD